MLIPNKNIAEGWHADPEARFYENAFWIYATRSAEFTKQLNLDAYSSGDGKTWTKHESIIDMSDYPYVHQAVWAPTIIDKDGKYYLIFATNDIHSDDEPGGLEIAVSDNPAGPFKSLFGDTLVKKIINGAQPIDAHLFKDDDGTIYLYYGGWGHCNVAVMNDTMDGFVPFPDGEIFREITPESYTEGPCMIKKDGKYYFMWSSGGWVDDSYGVCYSISDSPTGPFEKEDMILSTDPKVAKGPGHHGFLFDNDECFIVYHRRPLEETDANSRMLCIDKMIFSDGKILKIKMT